MFGNTPSVGSVHPAGPAPMGAMGGAIGGMGGIGGKQPILAKQNTKNMMNGGVNGL